jgi:hypothetical protein
MEPHIGINGMALTEAQAMTVRVAVNLFAQELQSKSFHDALGGMGPLYQQRLNENRRADA